MDTSEKDHSDSDDSDKPLDLSKKKPVVESLPSTSDDDDDDKALGSPDDDTVEKAALKLDALKIRPSNRESPAPVSPTIPRITELQKELMTSPPRKAAFEGRRRSSVGLDLRTPASSPIQSPEIRQDNPFGKDAYESLPSSSAEAMRQQRLQNRTRNPFFLVSLKNTPPPPRGERQEEASPGVASPAVLQLYPGKLKSPLDPDSVVQPNIASPQPSVQQTKRNLEKSPSGGADSASPTDIKRLKAVPETVPEEGAATTEGGQRHRRVSHEEKGSGPPREPRKRSYSSREGDSVVKRERKSEKE